MYKIIYILCFEYSTSFHDIISEYDHDSMIELDNDNKDNNAV